MVWSRFASARRIAFVAVSLLVGVAVLSGCRADLPRLEDDPVVARLAKEAAAARQQHAPPVPLRLALGRVELDHPAKPDLEKDDEHYPAALETPSVRAAIVRAVTLTSGLAAPRLEDGAWEAGPGPRRDRPSPAAFAGAFKAGDDLLIRPVFRSLDCVWGGRNWRYVPNMALFLYFWVPSFWVPAEDFALEGALDLEVWCVASERRLSVRHVPIGAKEHTYPLDDFERGWSWTGIVSAPGTIDANDWGTVGKNLTPLAELEAGRAAAIEIGETLTAEIRSGDLARAEATVFAYCCGVSSHTGRIAAPECGARDALGFASFLESAGRVPAKNVRTIVDQAATLQKWEDGFRAHLSRARPDDVALVYWSGCGAIGPDGEAYLAPFDADPDAIGERTFLSLARLRLLISKLAARRVVVVLDAAFGARRPGARSLPLPESVGRVPVEVPLASWAAAADGKDVTLLCAAGPGEGAVDFEGASRGLFTYFVEEGAAGRADADGDGEVAGGELEAYVQREVATQAGLDGAVQRPRVYRQGRPIGALDPDGRHAWLPNADFDVRHRSAAPAPKE